MKHTLTLAVERTRLRAVFRVPSFATQMRQPGINHEAFTHRHQGRDCRLTDVRGNIVKDMLA